GVADGGAERGRGSLARKGVHERGSGSAGFPPRVAAASAGVGTRQRRSRPSTRRHASGSAESRRVARALARTRPTPFTAERRRIDGRRIQRARGLSPSAHGISGAFGVARRGRPSAFFTSRSHKPSNG